MNPINLFHSVRPAGLLLAGALLLCLSPAQAGAQLIFEADFDAATPGMLPTGAGGTEAGRFSGTPALPHANVIVQSAIANGGNALEVIRSTTVVPLAAMRQNPGDFVPEAGTQMKFTLDFLAPGDGDSGGWSLAPDGVLGKTFFGVLIKPASQGRYISYRNSSGVYVNTTETIASNTWYTFELNISFGVSSPGMLVGTYDLQVTPKGGSPVVLGSALSTSAFADTAGLHTILRNEVNGVAGSDSITYWDNLKIEAIPEPSGVALAMMGFAVFAVAKWKTAKAVSPGQRQRK